VDAPRRFAALVARTVRAFAPRLARPDDAFAARWLSDGELAAFLAMDPRDRDHACRVARRLVLEHPEAEPVWVRAALLHDVGKSLAPYRAWERIAVHVARGWSPGVLARAPRLAAACARDRRHPEEGARVLADLGADPRLVALVAHHHRPAGDDPGARALAWADAGADADLRSTGRA
jgi:putative nucleotidyltransferase with HDIG domain